MSVRHIHSFLAFNLINDYLGFCQLKDGVTSLSSDISIVRHLEDVRALVCKHGDGPVDLLKAEPHGTASLGFTMAYAEPPEPGSSAQQGSFFVQKVIPGTSAHLDGRLLPGDEIVAIGGEFLKGSYESALDILKRPAAVGSLCAVRYKINGIISEVEVYRSPLSFVEESELLFVLLEHHTQAVEKEAAASNAGLVGSLQLFAEALLLSQRNRLGHERAMSRRLLGFQEDVLRLVTEAEKCLKPGRLEHAPLTPPGPSVQARRSPAPEQARPEPMHKATASDSTGASESVVEAEKQRMPVREVVLTWEAESLRAEMAQKTERIGRQAQELKRLRAHAESSPSASLHSTNTAALLGRSVERSPRPGPGPSDSESFSAASVASPYAEAAVRAPVMQPSSGRYTGKVDITVVSDVPGARLFCTRDTTTPSPSNYAACGPSPLRIELRHSAVLKCAAVPSHTGSAAAREAAVCRQESVVEPGPVTAESPPWGQASRPPTRSTPSPPSAAAAMESAIAGVGVLLEISDAAGRPGSGPLFKVKRLAPHGPAALDGKVEVGDVLEQVDGVAVRNRRLNEVRAGRGPGQWAHMARRAPHVGTPRAARRHAARRTSCRARHLPHSE